MLGHIHILDCDILEAGNSVRWTTGRSMAGLPKVAALKFYFQENYPFTKVDAAQWLLGLAPAYKDEGLSDEPKLIDEVLSGADLIIDASAATLANNFLADTALEWNLPYVWAHATPGGWGGLVGRIHPNRTAGCWACHRRWVGVPNGLPVVPAAPEGESVEPVGCAHPTFAASSMDLNEVSLMATRVATAALLSMEDPQISDYPFDISILRLRDEDGRPCLPNWSAHKLERHPECGCAGTQ